MVSSGMDSARLDRAGGTVAGGLIVLAGVGSLVTEWRRLYRLRQRAEERDVARDLLHSHGIGQGKRSAKS